MLTEDQILIQDTARRFAADKLRPNAAAWDEGHVFPRATIRQAADLGFAGIYVPEAHGGSGLTRLDAAVVFEALATGCPTTSAFLSIHNMVAWMIDRWGDDAQRAEWLPGLLTMEKIASYCLTEPGSGSDAVALSTAREGRDNEGYVMDGVKQFISGAGASDLYLTMARTGAAGRRWRLRRCWCRRRRAGLSFGANEKKMGWNAQPTRQVIFEGIAASPPRRCWARKARASAIAMAGLDGGRLNIAACSLGGRAGGARHRAGLREIAPRLRQGDLRFPGDAIPPGRHGDGAGSGAHLPLARLHQARPEGAGRHALLRHGQAPCHRCGPPRGG
jgi:alkylation response protein AidB-like acyl-CoA dehydrogenase